jgi:superfamily I DNA/RNA helicase
LKKLPRVTATPEQLPLISQNRFGVEVICGAAGSGKTSTALLRLRSLCHMFDARATRRGDTDPVRVLVLTFNRTLAGYVRSLAEYQIAAGLKIELQIDTFSRWAMEALNFPAVAADEAREKLENLSNRITELSASYVVNEAEYLLGRFPAKDIEDYITTERTGRGTQPRIGRELRRRILDEVVIPYQKWLKNKGVLDWNSVAEKMASEVDPIGYSIVIVDESQDFSANQLRAIKRHLAAEHAITFVIDTVQRIYARGFTWSEAGFDVKSNRVHVLRANHRNTSEIAAFAASILDGIGVEGDGALPNLSGTKRNGPVPTVICGKYSQQLSWAIKFIKDRVDLTNDSVAFLHPQGGAWFEALRSRLDAEKIGFVEISRKSQWPEGPENVALSTFHSAKGLEFDYVIILGLNHENTTHEDEEIDDKILVLRKLLAVAVARARKEVVVGYKPGEESRLVRHFSPGTFRQVTL